MGIYKTGLDNRALPPIIRQTDRQTDRIILPFYISYRIIIKHALSAAMPWDRRVFV